MSEYGLHSIHFSCLYYVYNAEGLTSKELCDHCEENKGAVSRALLYLEEQGFLVSRKQGKRCNEPLSLMNKGKEAGKKITMRIENALGIVSSGITEEDCKILYESLSKISDGLESLLTKTVDDKDVSPELRAATIQ